MNASEIASLGPAPSAFGQIIKRLRVAADLTQEELAERAGVSERLISDYERGTIHRPRRNTLQLLANGLCLSELEYERFVNIARGQHGSERQRISVAPQIHGSVPLPISRLVGREADVDKVSALLVQPDVHLVTLTGPGGVGKTRLSVEIASRLKPLFSEGVYFVDLASVREPDLVLATIARVLGVKPSSDLPLNERLAHALQSGTLLLVLDNFEHVAPAATDIAELLVRCDQLTILTTSRAILQVRSEHVYPVEPLELPNPEHIPSLSTLSRIPAVEFLLSRAKSIDPSFELTNENAPCVAGITIRLDGLPLAIELAAARLAVLSPQDLLDRLDHRFPLLSGGARDMPERLQTMSGAIDWSYGLLSGHEQRLFRRLAIFAGGFTLNSAEELSGAEPALDGITSLVHKSLLHTVDGSYGERRFKMLETIREYGLEKLGEHGELSEARSGQLAWCLSLVQRAGPNLMGPDQAVWLARLDREQANLRLALTTAINEQDAQSAATICGSIFEYWEVRSLFDEGRRWLDRTMALDSPVSLDLKARVLLGQGVLAFKRGDYDGAEVLNEALVLFTELNDEAGIAYAIASLGRVAMARRAYDCANACYQEAMELFSRLGEDFWAGRMRHNMGLVAYDQGNYLLAIALTEDALALARASGGADSIAVSLNNLALFSTVCGDHNRAVMFQLEALHLWLAIGKTEGIAHSLENLALVAVSQHRHVRAARLFGAAETVRVRIGAPGRLNDRELNQRKVDEIRATIGDAALDREWRLGRSMTMDEAVSCALEAEDER